jgi:hypothetical protein
MCGSSHIWRKTPVFAQEDEVRWGISRSLFRIWTRWISQGGRFMSKGSRLLRFTNVDLPTRSLWEIITLPIRLMGGVAIESGAGSYISRLAINVPVETKPNLAVQSADQRLASDLPDQHRRRAARHPKQEWPIMDLQAPVYDSSPTPFLASPAARWLSMEGPAG